MAEVVKVLMSHVNSVPLLREEALISGLVDACMNPTDQQLISYGPGVGLWPIHY